LLFPPFLFFLSFWGDLFKKEIMNDRRSNCSQFR
jgi:hypothetical protein